MVDKKKITKRTIAEGVGIIALILATGIALDSENIYYCEEREIVMVCDKLSAINDDGGQTRCYFYSEEKQRGTYKICDKGWIEYDPTPVERKRFIAKNESVYLLCERKNKLINECQEINTENIVYKVG